VLLAKSITDSLPAGTRQAGVTPLKTKTRKTLILRALQFKEVMPHDSEDYVHRARVNETGEAITLVTQREMHKVRKIVQLIKSSIPKLQPPSGIGRVPEWKEEEVRTGDKRKFYR
jgi:hypothetical protein